jgi:hypothetical protein
MSIEALHLFVFSDDSDTILARQVVSGGEAKRMDFMDHSSVMVLLNKNESDAGIFLNHPDSVETTLYESAEDMEGISMKGKMTIPLRPGEELRIWTEYSKKEIWLTHDGSGKRTDMFPGEIPVSNIP